MREEGILLRHKTDLPFARRHKKPLCRVTPDFIAEMDLSFFGTQETSQTTQYRRLARTGRPKENSDTRKLAGPERISADFRSSREPLRETGLNLPAHVFWRRVNASLPHTTRTARAAA